jgi:hypothetical protein
MGGTLQKSYNNVWENGDNYLGCSQGPTEISANPNFVNAVGNNYRISSYSLCKHSGDPAAGYNNRNGTRNDIGAFGGP